MLTPLPDPTRYDGIAVPFVIRHDNRSVEVCYRRDSLGLPVRVPNFHLTYDHAKHMEDKEIIAFAFIMFAIDDNLTDPEDLKLKNKLIKKQKKKR